MINYILNREVTNMFVGIIENVLHLSLTKDIAKARRKFILMKYYGNRSYEVKLRSRLCQSNPISCFISMEVRSEHSPDMIICIECKVRLAAKSSLLSITI